MIPKFFGTILCVFCVGSFLKNSETAKPKETKETVCACLKKINHASHHREARKKVLNEKTEFDTHRKKLILFQKGSLKCI